MCRRGRERRVHRICTSLGPIARRQLQGRTAACAAESCKNLVLIGDEHKRLEVTHPSFHLVPWICRDEAGASAAPLLQIELDMDEADADVAGGHVPSTTVNKVVNNAPSPSDNFKSTDIAGNNADTRNPLAAQCTYAIDNKPSVNPALFFAIFPLILNHFSALSASFSGSSPNGSNDFPG